MLQQCPSIACNTSFHIYSVVLHTWLAFYLLPIWEKILWPSFFNSMLELMQRYVQSFNYPRLSTPGSLLLGAGCLTAGTCKILNRRETKSQISNPSIGCMGKVKNSRNKFSSNLARAECWISNFRLPMAPFKFYIPTHLCAMINMVATVPKIVVTEHPWCILHLKNTEVDIVTTWQTPVTRLLKRPASSTFIMPRLQNFALRILE